MEKNNELKNVPENQNKNNEDKNEKEIEKQIENLDINLNKLVIDNKIEKAASTSPDKKEENIIVKNEEQKIIPITKFSSLSPVLFSLLYISEYKCFVCGLIPSPETAMEKECCSVLICYECFKKQNNPENNQCLTCNSPKINYRQIKTENKIFYKTFKNIKINCPYKCEWNGAWGDFDTHLNQCKYSIRYCKYNSIGCKFCDENKKVFEHEKNNDKMHLEMALEYIKNNKIVKNQIKFVLGEKIMTSVHSHQMTYMTSWTWHCDGEKLPNHCYSGNPTFPKTTPRFRCAPCDFDLCDKCIVKYVINSN